MTLFSQRFWELVSYSVTCNLKAESKKYALSYLWWVIEPTLNLLVLYLVFGVFLGQNNNPHYIAFLFCGLVPWFWINKSVSNGLGSIIGGKNILRDTYIPKYFFSTVSILQDSVKELIVFATLLVTLLLSGITPTNTWLLLPILMLLELLLIAALVYCVSIITPYFLDLKYVVVTFLQVVMFASGIFYDYQLMPEHYQAIFLLNPVAVLINMYRDILIYQQVFSLNDFLYVAWYVLTFGLLAMLLNKHLDREVSRVLYR